MTNDCGVTFWGINGVYYVALFKRRERIETAFVNIFYYAVTKPVVPVFVPNTSGGLSLFVYDIETSDLLERKHYDALGNEVTE